MIVLFATLANVDDWVEMEYFANYHQDYLRKYIELKKIICIDGKTMRSNKRKKGRPNHIVSAWSRGKTGKV